MCQGRGHRHQILICHTNEALGHAQSLDHVHSHGHGQDRRRGHGHALHHPPHADALCHGRGALPRQPSSE